MADIFITVGVLYACNFQKDAIEPKKREKPRSMPDGRNLQGGTDIRMVQARLTSDFDPVLAPLPPRSLGGGRARSPKEGG